MLEINSLAQMLALVNSTAKVTVIDFYADWCGPCQVIRPQYERLANYYDSSLVAFCKCNVDRCRECAAHFEVRAMPTFVICVGGATIGVVQGGDLGVVQRHVDMALGQVRAAPGAALGGAGRAAGAGARQQQDAFAEQMILARKAKESGNTIAEKDACAAAHKLLWSHCSDEHPAATREPFGALLLPYLASEAFSPVSVSSLFHYLSLAAQPACTEGELIVNQCLRFVIQMLSTCTWDDTAVITSMHRAVLALVQVPETQAILSRSIFFYDDMIGTGMGLEQNTLLGAFFGLGPYLKGAGRPVDNRNQLEWQCIMKLFPPNAKEQHEQTVQAIQHNVAALAMMNRRLAEALLRSHGTRETTLRFFGRALHLNEDYQKTIHHRSPLATRYFMIQLQSVLIELALPVFSRGGGGGGVFDPSAIPPCYVLAGGKAALQHRCVVDFGEGVERVTHYDEANPLPTIPTDTPPFKPAVHLFFLTARAVTLCGTVFIDAHDQSDRNAHHPMSPPNQRDAFDAERRLYESLIGGEKLAASRLQFLNGLGRWLLYVMGATSAGELPETPPKEWNYLPQCLVDSVIRGTQMAPVDALYLDGIVSVMLVLMGNTRYFPKPHTHALFPAFLLRCLQNHEAKRAVENHVWFSSRIIRACIDCYIAVEKCPYEKTQVRYELSHCIKSFLRYDSLCDPVREEFKSEGTILERFSHMAVGEVNESVDQLIENLTKMNTMMKEGADLSENAVPVAAGGNGGASAAGASGARANEEAGADGDDEEDDSEGDAAGDGERTYHQLGEGLRSHVALFSASMGMFIALSDQFPRGVSQNLVAQQISQMLARSLIAFAGPQSGRLKIEHASRYNFNPREILSTLVDCLTRFRRTSNFLRCLCQGGVALGEVRGAMQMVIARKLVSEELTWKLSEMDAALGSIQQDVTDEELLWDEAPDHCLDALLSTPLTNPVALPSDVKDMDDLVYVNKDTIHHLLLSENKHPFTKAYLDEKMVDEFNARPEVTQHREALRKSIAAWLEEAKAAARAAKAEKS